MTWTDLNALAAAILRTTSREEALALVHDATPTARPVLPRERRADPLTVAGARAVLSVCHAAPPRPRPRASRPSLFDRRGAGQVGGDR